MQLWSLEEPYMGHSPLQEGEEEEEGEECEGRHMEAEVPIERALEGERRTKMMKWLCGSLLEEHGQARLAMWWPSPLLLEALRPLLLEEALESPQ